MLELRSFVLVNLGKEWSASSYAGTFDFNEMSKALAFGAVDDGEA